MSACVLRAATKIAERPVDGAVLCFGSGTATTAGGPQQAFRFSATPVPPPSAPVVAARGRKSEARVLNAASPMTTSHTEPETVATVAEVPPSPATHSCAELPPDIPGARRAQCELTHVGRGDGGRRCVMCSVCRP